MALRSRHQEEIKRLKQVEELKRLEEERNRLEEEVRLEGQNAERSAAAKQNSLSRAYKSFPNNPVKFTETLDAVINKAVNTPRKQQLIQKKGLKSK